MFETAQKYSEMAYYSKQDIERELDHYLVDPIWHEICQYREMFRYEFPLQDKKTYLIRNPLVNDSIFRTQEMIRQYLMQPKEDISNIDIFWLQEAEVECFKHTITQMGLHVYYDHNITMLHLIEQMHLQKRIRKDALKFLLNTQQNVLLQLFMLTMDMDKKAMFVLQYPILRAHGMFSLANIIHLEDICDAVDKGLANLDVTSSFLSFLVQIRLKLSNEMVLLKPEQAPDVKEMQYQELIERFPNLAKAQVTFFLHHRTYQRYYTIQDYMKFCEVCYETARYSLEEFVTMRWYQKQKMGKKFVYFIM